MAAQQQGHIVPTKPAPLDAHIISPPVPLAEMTDAELGASAAAAVERHIAMRDGAVEHAVRAGELLREGRARCQRNSSSWAAWLQRYWPKSRQTAQRYMALALEVSQLSGPRAGAASALLGLPSVRAALTEIGYDAGETRDHEADPEEREAREEATIERLIADAHAEPERPAPRQRPQPTQPRQPEGKSDAEKARQATAAADAAKWRAQVEEAAKRPPLTQQPPENPHQVGHPKVSAPLTAFPSSLAPQLREVVALFADARRRLLLLVLGAPTPSTTKQLGEAQHVFLPLVERWEQVLGQIADEDQESVEFTIERLKAERKRGA